MTEIIIAIVGSGAISTVATLFFTKRKTKADVIDTYSENVLKWATQMQDQIGKLHTEIEGLSLQNTELRAQVTKLSEQNIELVKEITDLKKVFCTKEEENVNVIS